jgi:hypothetical protein
VPTRRLDSPGTREAAAVRVTPPAPTRPAAAWRVVGVLPVVLPAALAGYSVVAMLALVGHVLHPALVLPVGGAAALAAGWAALRLQPTDEPDRERRWADLGALVLTLLCLAGNVVYASQNIVVFRDPAFYALTGQHLTDATGLPIDAGAEVFGSTPGLTYTSNGFGLTDVPGEVEAQGAHLLPALLAGAGWLTFWTDGAGLLKAAPAIGALALWAIYGFGRLLVRPALALLAVAALGVTLPQLHFSRATYTEPLAQVFVFGGLTLLWQAHVRQRDGLFALAGLVFGCVALTRIDGLLNLLALPIWATVVLVTAPVGARGRAARQVALLAAPVVAVVLICLRDLTALSAIYWHNLRDEIATTRLLLVGLLVVGAAVVALGWRTGLSRRLAWLPAAGAGIVLLAFAVLASRPLWYVGRREWEPNFRAGIEFLQRGAGLSVDGSRTYAEISLNWIWWYTGRITLLLGVVGLAVLTARLVGDLIAGPARVPAVPPPVLAVFLALVGTGAVYLAAPNIAPDQIWASRRLLVVVFPAVLLGAAVVIGWLLARPGWPRLVAAVLVAAVALAPLLPTRHLLRHREGVSQLGEIRAVCRALPPDAAVLTLGSLKFGYLQTIRSYCDVPAGALAEDTPAKLAAVRAEAQRHGRQLYVMALGRTGVGAVTASVNGFPPFRVTPLAKWSELLTQPASTVSNSVRTLYLGMVQPDGRVRFLTGG